MIFDLSKDIELVSEITSSFFNVGAVKVSAIVGKGTVNRVFVVETGDAKAVVRMRDQTEAFEEYTKEAWCITKAAAQGVPVPEVLSIGRREKTAYMIESHIAGDEGRDSLFPAAYIWRRLGKYARLIHTIEVAGFGLKLSDLTEGDSRELWLKYLEYNIESLSDGDRLLELKVLTKPQSKIIRNIFENLKEREFKFGLSHGDLSLKNTIVERGGKVILLDWGSAEAAIVPHHDLIEILNMNMLENEPDEPGIGAFLGGYGISPTAFRLMLPELESLLLLQAFDKLRWALDWKIEETEDYASHARRAVERKLRGNRVD